MPIWALYFIVLNSARSSDVPFCIIDEEESPQRQFLAIARVRAQVSASLLCDESFALAKN